MASGLTATTRYIGVLVGVAALGAVLTQIASRRFILGGVEAGLDAETAAELAKHVTSGDVAGIVSTVPEALRASVWQNRQCGLRRWIRCGGAAGGCGCRGGGAVHGASGAARRDVAGHGWQHSPRRAWSKKEKRRFPLIDHCSKREFFGRLAAAAEACLLEQSDATAHLVCAAVLREAYSMAKQMDEDEFDFLIVAEVNQIGEDPTLPGQRTGYSSIKETIEFFRGRGIQIHGTV
jgi:hypothetical protein